LSFISFIACAENLQLSQDPQIGWQLYSSCSESSSSAIILEYLLPAKIRADHHILESHARLNHSPIHIHPEQFQHILVISFENT
jgi:hypothetical protein